MIATDTSTFEARRLLLSCSAILNENEFMNTYTSQQDPYDQYEVAVPIEVVGDCMAKVQSLLTTHLAHLRHNTCLPPSHTSSSTIPSLQDGQRPG